MHLVVRRTSLLSTGFLPMEIKCMRLITGKYGISGERKWLWLSVLREDVAPPTCILQTECHLGVTLHWPEMPVSKDCNFWTKWSISDNAYHRCLEAEPSIESGLQEYLLVPLPCLQTLTANDLISAQQHCFYSIHYSHQLELSTPRMPYICIHTCNVDNLIYQASSAHEQKEQGLHAVGKIDGCG